LEVHFQLVVYTALCREKSIKVLARTAVDLERRGSYYTKIWPNLLGGLGEIANYHINKDTS